MFGGGLIGFSRISKGANGRFEHPSLWNDRSIDYKNYTSNWHNFTIVSERMNPEKYMHYIEALNVGQFPNWNNHENFSDIIVQKILNYRGRTLTLWQGDF